jgi:uncharacterized protein (TIGR02246 family)
MNDTATSALPAILVGGLTAGTVDIGAAALINHVSPVLIAHYIASGLLGKASFSMGTPAVCLGVILQWAMSVLIAAIYWYVTARMPRLRARWWLGGLAAGIIIYPVMNFLVMPFSAAPVTLHQVIARLTADNVAANLAAMLVFGWIVAFCARGSRRRAGDHPSAGRAGSAVVSVASLAAALALFVLARPSSADSTGAQSPDPVTVISSAKNAIDAANSGWVPAMERGDADAVAAAYANDGVLVTSKGEAIRGRAAVAARYRAELALMGRITGGGLVQEGVTVSNGMIYEWGHGWLASRRDGKQRMSSGPYFTVWRRGPDGSWKILRNLVL